MKREDDDVRQTVHRLICSFAPSPPTDSVVAGRNLVRDLGYHSLALLELAFALEDEFDLPPMDEQQAQGISTVDQLVEYVILRLHSSAS